MDLKRSSILAGVAGAVNAAGFQASGYFSANMTGNVSAFSDYLGIASFEAAQYAISLVATFIFGAFVSGLLIEFGQRRNITAIYAYSLILEAILLFAVAIIDLSTNISNISIPFYLSAIMGIQNAASSKVTSTRTRTTHISGTATDIGIYLAELAYSKSSNNEAKRRLKYSLATILSFIAAGVIGVITYIYFGSAIFMLAGIVLIGMSMSERKREVHKILK